MHATSLPTRHGSPLAALLRCLVVAGIAIFLGWQLHRDWAAVSGLRLHVLPADLLAALASGLFGLLCLPLAFALTLRCTGLYRSDCRLFYCRIWLQAYLYRYVPGKVLLLVERVRLGALAGIDRGQSVLLVAWETLLLLVGAGLALLLLLGLAAPGGDEGRWLAAGAVLAVVMLAVFPFCLRLVARLLPRLAWLTGLQLRYRDQLLLVAVYGLAWLGLGASFFFACRFFVPLPLAAMPAVEFWFIGAYVAGLVSAVAPAGLGVREGIVAAGLAGLVGGGEAVALAVAGRLWMTLVELACIAVARLIPAPREERS